METPGRTGTGEGQHVKYASSNIRGAALMSLCMLAFVSNDACMRAIAGELPLAQATLIRSSLATLLLICVFLMMRDRGVVPRAGDRRLIGLRALAEVATGTTVLIAIYNMELGVFTAILQSAPLAITLAGALFLGERIGWRRLLAIVVGFTGVLLIIRPGTEAFNAWSLVALVAVGFLTVRDLSARRISGVVSPVLTALAGSATVLLFSTVWACFVDLQPVNLRQAAILVASSCFLASAYVLAVFGMRSGDISFVAPFRYTGLLWALAIGMIFLAERPDMWTLIGAGIVVASGGYSLWREIRIARSRRGRSQE